MHERRVGIARLRSGKPVRFRPSQVGARDTKAFERWLIRQAERSEYGEQAAVLMAIMFYCDPNAKCTALTRR